MNEFMDSIHSDKSREDETNLKKEQFKDEIKEFEELITKLNNTECLIIDSSQKISLAFFIEEIKKKNPESWQDELNAFKCEIDDKAKEGGRAEVSWLLSERVSRAYSDFLMRREEEVKDEALKRKIRMIRKIAEQNLEFNHNGHQKGEPVAFGGVSIDYVPGWYYYKDL